MLEPDIDVNYPIYNDYSIFTNILFIDRNISQYQTFIDAANANTYPISYSSLFDDVTKLNEFLFNTFTNIDRVCFAFHGHSLDTIESSISFIQNAPFFVDDDLATDVTDFSKNILFIQNLINTLHVKHIDYLGCNLLTFSNWKTYFELIEKNTSVIVGASNDETGNLNYGGDWLMENTNENIKQIYFNETIDTFIGVLDTSLSYYAYNFDFAWGPTVQYIYTEVNQVSTLTGINAGAGNTISQLGFVRTIQSNTALWSNINYIGNNAFASYGYLQSVIIPEGVLSIGDSAFNSSGISSIVLPTTLETIGQTAFNWTNLKAITIPVSVTFINPTAIYVNPILRSILVESGNADYSSFAGVLFADNQTELIKFPAGYFDSTNFITNPKFVYPVIDPETSTQYLNGVFHGWDYSGVVLNNNAPAWGYPNIGTGSPQTQCVSIQDNNHIKTVDSIYFKAGCTYRLSISYCSRPLTAANSIQISFEDSSNWSVIISESYNTNQWVNYTTDITIYVSQYSKLVFTGLATWETNGDKSCAITDISLSLTSKNTEATNNTYTIPDTVTTIGEYAFYNCPALTSVTIPNTVTTIGEYAFQSCHALTSVIIPNSVTTIGDIAFHSCIGLVSVIIGTSVTTISHSMFQYCHALTSVTIPNSVTTINSYAFYDCYALTSVTIPDSVTTIGENAFGNCTALNILFAYKNNIKYYYEGTIDANTDRTIILSGFINNNLTDWAQSKDIGFLFQGITTTGTIVTGYKTNGVDLGSLFAPFPSYINGQTTAPNTTWNSVTMSSSGQYIAGIIYRGGIYISSDYGHTWVQRVSGNTSTTRMSLVMSATGEFMATCINASGGAANIYRSVNYGQNWQGVSGIPSNVSWTHMSMSASGQYVVACINTIGGKIYISSDYGNTWGETSAPTPGWSSIDMSDSGQYMAACSNQGVNIYISSDYGNTWSNNNDSPASTSILFFSLVMSSSGNYIAAIDYGGGIYVSSNYGSNWHLTYEGNVYWTDIAMSSSGQYMVAVDNGGGGDDGGNGLNGGAGGDMYISYNYGVDWTNIITTSSSNLNTIDWASVTMSSSGNYIAASVFGGGIYALSDILPTIATGYKVNGVDLGSLFEPYSSGSVQITGYNKKI